jgi:hypothetical protein
MLPYSSSALARAAFGHLWIATDVARCGLYIGQPSVGSNAISTPWRQVVFGALLVWCSDLMTGQW